MSTLSRPDADRWGTCAGAFRPNRCEIATLRCKIGTRRPNRFRPKRCEFAPLRARGVSGASPCPFPLTDRPEPAGDEGLWFGADV